MLSCAARAFQHRESLVCAAKVRGDMMQLLTAEHASMPLASLLALYGSGSMSPDHLLLARCRTKT